MTENVGTDMLHRLLQTMKNNVGLRLTNAAEGYTVEKVTIEHLKEHNRRKDKFNIICLLIRPVAGKFCAELEQTHYEPGTPKNAKFGCIYFKWNDLMFAIISIPLEDKPKAVSAAKKVGARLADGVPTLIGGDDPKFDFGGVAPAEMFPLDNLQTFNLEGAM